ncbi:MAG: putative lipid II flippase FtsW [Anaerolineae bacterium]|nr:putative lipid II flippase FtsW [Anaerolineae bacterium]
MVGATLAARSSQKAVKQTRRHGRGMDYALLLTVLGLLFFGMMMVYSATFDWSYQVYQDSFRIASRQFLWVGLGLVVMVVVAFIPYDWWQGRAVPVMGVALLLLILVLLVGDDTFGARRSFFNGSIQPGELMKPAMVIYVAAWLVSKGEDIRHVTYGLIPFAVLIGVIAGLVILQPDVSTAILLVMIALAMFFFAGADIFQLAAGGVIGGITFLVLINQLPHARQRLDEYLAAWEDPLNMGYHVQQSLIALGSGGLFGTGLGQGQQKLGYLPAPHTDSIFAIVGEETGFLGCMVVIGLFAFLTYRGIRIALHAPDAFAALLAGGVTCWLTFQALVNLGVITGLLPFTGVALPFVSAGGSAMLTSLAGVGLLLSVSRGKRARSKELRGQKRADLDRRWWNGGTRLPRAGRGSGTAR